MRAHDEFISLFGRSLKAGGLPPGATTIAPAETERRFAVYRNNVAVSLVEALARRFPVIKRLVGVEFFNSMGRVYAEEYRPSSPVLLEWGESFPQFLREFPPLADYPYMADVARIELSRGIAYHAADAIAAAGADFVGCDPHTLCLRIHPSVQVLRLDYPAVSIWQRNQAGSTGKQPLPNSPEMALVLRDRNFDVPVWTIGPGDAELLEAIQKGVALNVAAEAALEVDPATDPGPMIMRLLNAGAILARTENESC